MAGYKGQIKGFPKEVVDRMLAEAKSQGRNLDIATLERNSAGGFVFDESPEGWDFWKEVIGSQNFDVFFDKYPKTTTNTTTEYEGSIKGFPKEVVDKMLDEMELYGNARSIKVLEKSRSSGFSFYSSSDGYKFWRAVTDGDFGVFFDKYPKTTTNTTTEYEGSIKGFPKEVVDKMLERQVEAGNPRSVEVFELNKWAGGNNKGFDWGDSVEGTDFWTKVIGSQNFDVFFEKYPKDSEPAEEPKVEIDETFSSVDGFIDSNKDALQEMSKDSPIVFDALNNVLAELRVAYEGAEPVKKVKKVVKKKKKTTPKPKPVPKVVVEEEEEIDLDSLMEDMEDMDDLMDDIDNLDCEI